MLLGIGFLTVTTASITGAFVARTRRDERAAGANGPSAEQFDDSSSASGGSSRHEPAAVSLVGITRRRI